MDPERSRRTLCFRRLFDLDAAPRRAPARLTADSRYALFVNGVEVARGPVRSNPRRLHYDALDLAPHLRAGRNVIAALVRFYGRPTPWWAPARPTLGLGQGAFVLEARIGPDLWLPTDEEWRVHRPDAWEELPARGIGGMPPESFDARKLDPAWRDLAFDDSAWKRATPLPANFLGFGGRHEPPSHPYGALRPRPIPELTGEVREAVAIARAEGPAPELHADPVDQVTADESAATARERIEPAGKSAQLEVAPGSAHVLTFDFGEVVSGTVLLDLEAPEGTRFDLAASELLRADGALLTEEQHSGLRYVARGPADRFETFDTIGLRYAAISVRGKGRVSVRSLRVRERLYPRPRGPFFECSDPLLEKIWAVGRRTVDLCSHDAYLDCPTREQRAWTGDFVVHQMVDLTTNPDWGLARWNVELCASPRPDGMLPMAAAGDIEAADVTFIPDWALHWVRALHNLYRYTGDRDLVARLLPVAENVLRWFVSFRGEDGLLHDVTGWVIIDWSSVSVEGCSSVLNALWARGLLDFAEMSEWLGDEGRAAWARESHGEVARAFEAFWDPERLLYADHVVDGRRRRPVSQHAQAAALCARLVPKERVARLVELLLNREREVHATWSRPSGDARFPRLGERGVGGPYLLAGPPEPWWDVEKGIVKAQPFFRYVVHDALAAAGREDLIPSLCREWQELLARSETSWSETWYGGTISHGWCSTPTRDLMTRTLGVTPAEPGFVRARVAPRLGPLAWARGAVPTPRGLLRVDVSAERVEIESPVPFELDLGTARSEHPAGRHTVPRA
jgi:hypothetical protein